MASFGDLFFNSVVLGGRGGSRAGAPEDVATSSDSEACEEEEDPVELSLAEEDEGGDGAGRGADDCDPWSTFRDELVDTEHRNEDAAPHMFRMPGQRREALARGHVPHLGRLVPRPGDDAPAVGEDGDATNLNQGDSQPSTQKTETRRRRTTPDPNAPSTPTSHIPIARWPASRRTRPWPRPTP